MKRSVARLLVSAIIMSEAVFGMGATMALAATTRTSTPVRLCTYLSDPSCAPVWTIPSGTSVSMKCWVDESWYSGTNRWFWISGGGVEGFVSANQVVSQTAVGWCNGNSAMQAARWAGTKLGESVYVNQCLLFAHDAWINWGPGKDIGSGGTAWNYWRTNPKGYRRGYDVAPPIGALVFWGQTSGYPEGHVAISIGSGWAISTYERSTTPVHVMSIPDRNRTKPYVGYLIP